MSCSHWCGTLCFILSTITWCGLTEKWLVFWYIMRCLVDHYCLRLDRGVVRVSVISIIIAREIVLYCDWLYCQSLYLLVWQRSTSFCVCLYCRPLLFRYITGIIRIVFIRYIFNKYYLEFDRGMTCIFVIVYITVWGYTEDWFVMLWLVILSTLLLRFVRGVDLAVVNGWPVGH